jgi:hypothetical protein
MKNKSLVVGFTLGFLALCAGAQTTETVFKVKMFGGLEILSAVAPVPSGSMLLVKNLSDGSLTAVPAELVANVTKTRAGSAITMKGGKTLVPASRLVTNTNTGDKSILVMPGGQKVSGALTTAKRAETLTAAGVPATLAGDRGITISDSVSAAKARDSLVGSLTAARPAPGLKTDSITMTSLAPGQTIVLGATGGTTAAAPRIGTTGVSAGTATSPLSASALARSVENQIFVGDLQRLTPTAGLAVGMVAPTTGEVVIGPNGFPVPVTSTTSASATPIGPNGFPDISAARGAATASNGFPATGTAASTGLTRAGEAITTAVPVTVSPGTAATAGSIATPGTSVGTTSAAAPATASPR